MNIDYGGVFGVPLSGQRRKKKLRKPVRIQYIQSRRSSGTLLYAPSRRGGEIHLPVSKIAKTSYAGGKSIASVLTKKWFEKRAIGKKEKELAKKADEAEAREKKRIALEELEYKLKETKDERERNRLRLARARQQVYLEK